MANNKMTVCKACGEEVAKSAKMCPKCGAKVKKFNPVVTGIILVVALIAIIAAVSGEDEPKKLESSQSGQPDSSAVQTEGTEKKEDKNVFYMGETAVLKGVEVSLVNVTESTGSDFNTPEEGNVFVLCEFDIHNGSDEEINVSSMLSFEAYCDEYACTYSLPALLEKGNKNQLDGSVAAGKRFNGVIGYEVPENWEELEVRFKPSIWSGKDMVFVAKNES